MYSVERSQYFRLMEVFVQRFGLDCQIFTATVALDDYSDPIISGEAEADSKVLLGAPFVTFFGGSRDYVENNLPIPAIFKPSVDVGIDWVVKVKQVSGNQIHWRCYKVVDRKTDAYLGLPVVYYLTPLRADPTTVEDKATPFTEGAQDLY